MCVDYYCLRNLSTCCTSCEVYFVRMVACMTSWRYHHAISHPRQHQNVIREVRVCHLACRHVIHVIRQWETRIVYNRQHDRSCMYTGLAAAISFLFFVLRKFQIFFGHHYEYEYACARAQSPSDLHCLKITRCTRTLFVQIFVSVLYDSSKVHRLTHNLASFQYEGITVVQERHRLVVPDSLTSAPVGIGFGGRPVYKASCLSRSFFVFKQWAYIGLQASSSNTTATCLARQAFAGQVVCKWSSTPCMIAQGSPAKLQRESASRHHGLRLLSTNTH